MVRKQVHVHNYIYKKNNIYKDNAEDLEIRLDTSNYELDRPLPKT